jgi:hypothetical protein
MTVWDAIIALSGIDDYIVRYDEKRQEIDIARAPNVPPTDKIIPVTLNRWQRILNGAKHLHL